MDGDASSPFAVSTLVSRRDAHWSFVDAAEVAARAGKRLGSVHRRLVALVRRWDMARRWAAPESAPALGVHTVLLGFRGDVDAGDLSFAFCLYGPPSMHLLVYSVRHAACAREPADLIGPRAAEAFLSGFRRIGTNELFFKPDWRLDPSALGICRIHGSYALQLCSPRTAMSVQTGDDNDKKEDTRRG